ncbi:BREX-3 system P-loop-containing protein BrxF [Clostridium celatum]|uniref:BREX-3 system P-loop-containing protein BrxF n=1 Tax=Clostridium celatum TaxID=36834 RepID=UPI0018972ABF
MSKYIYKELDSKINKLTNGLILITNSFDKAEIKIQDYKYISLGESLSKKLIKNDKVIRNRKVKLELDNIILNNDNTSLVVDNIDILFNPEYKLNILKYFENVSKKKKIILVWPGNLDKNELVYSKLEFNDYKRYKIKDYNFILLK